MNKLWNLSTFKRGDNVEEFLSTFDQQCKLTEVKEKNKTNLLVNSLDADVQYELFSLLDYKDNADDYSWVSKTLQLLFGVKKTKISPLANLLQVRQQPGQTTREFVSQIRIQGFKTFGDSDPQNREKAMVTAFLNGLLNQSVAKAAATVDFKSLDECFKAVKKDTGNNSPTAEGDFCLIQKTENSGLLQELVNTVTFLKNQVSYLITVVNKGQLSKDKSVKNNSFRNPINRTPNKITCFNCNKQGHYANNCTNRPFCINCNKAGHNLRTCKTRNQTLHQIEGERYRDNASINEDYSDNGEISDEIHQVCMVQVEKTPDIKSIATPVKQVNNKSIAQVNKNMNSQKQSKRTYPDEIIQWSNFIEGKGKKPVNTFATAVKSTIKINKPIITATIENERKNIFLDSGAELNVISSEVASKLIKSNNKIRHNTTSRNLKCANGTTMSSLGKIELNISLVPGKFEKMIFDIVPKISPSILLGIRQLKKSNININANKNLAIVSGFEIPFSSKIYSPTTFSGNGASQPLRRE